MYDCDNYKINDCLVGSFVGTGVCCWLHFHKICLNHFDKFLFLTFLCRQHKVSLINQCGFCNQIKQLYNFRLFILKLVFSNC